MAAAALARLVPASGRTLLAFHGWLFAAQAAEGRLEDPWLVFRWLAALGLVAALASVRHAGGSIWNRQGLAVWVLAALLHGPAMATDFGKSINLAPPETVATSILHLCFGSALTATRGCAPGLGSAIADALLHLSGPRSFPAGFFADGFTPQYPSRPPPHRLNVPLFV